MPTLFGMSLLAFALVAAAPGDPVLTEALRQGIVLTPVNEAALRVELGLDGSWPERYAHWLAQALRGDFGYSIASRRPVSAEISSHLAPTLQLAAAAMATAMPLALLAGLAAALTRSRVVAALLRGATVLVVSTPGYWLALLGLYLFAVHLEWTRVLGDGLLGDLWLPAVVLGLGAAAPASRLIRDRAFQVMSEDPLRLAIAQGLAPWHIVLTRIVPATLVPAITMWANSLGGLLGGAVIVETVFGWPGLGRLVLQSIAERDLPVLQAYLCLMGLVFVTTSLAADLVVSWLDPRPPRLGGH
jgi:ABC-type dipeptide/oligopeptide/nickel transport system permease component